MLAVLAIAGAGSWCAWNHWMRLEGENSARRREFWFWAAKGVAFPCLIWCVANLGLGSRFPAIVPRLADAQISKAPWAGLWVAACIYGTSLILTWWCAITYAWLLARMAARTPKRGEFAFNVAVIGFFSVLVAVSVGYVGGINAIGAAIVVAILPIVHLTLDLAEEPVPRPYYDRALAHLKLGKYDKAEWEVISQLEKCENDFDGWMLLAELYAKQFRNLEDAARVVLDLCQDPATQPVHISVACHKLADWQLEVYGHAEAARASLELLCRKLPGTHFARMAEQRLKQIPRTSEEYAAAKIRRPVRLPPTPGEQSGRKTCPPVAGSDRKAAAAEANRLAERLTEDPNDVPARELLAQVLAERLGKTELAEEQLRLLIEMPDLEDEQKARWRAQIAAWNFDRDANEQKLLRALRELVRDYPQTSQAFAAQRRIFLLETGLVPQPAGPSLPRISV